MGALVGGWVSDRVKKARELAGLARQAGEERAEEGQRRAERVADDIRRDIEKLEQKRKAKE